MRCSAEGGRRDGSMYFTVLLQMVMTQKLGRGWAGWGSSELGEWRGLMMGRLQKIEMKLFGRD